MSEDVVEASQSRPPRSRIRKALLVIISDDRHGDRAFAEADTAASNVQLAGPRRDVSNPMAVTSINAQSTFRSRGKLDRWSLALSAIEKARLLGPSRTRAVAISRLERWVYCQAAAVVAVTQQDAERMQASMNRVHTSTSSVRVNGIQPRPALIPCPNRSFFTLRPTGHFYGVGAGADGGGGATAVELANFEVAARVSVRERSGCLFVGTGENRANVESVARFLKHVWYVLNLCLNFLHFCVLLTFDSLLSVFCVRCDPYLPCSVLRGVRRKMCV